MLLIPGPNIYYYSVKNMNNYISDTALNSRYYNGYSCWEINLTNIQLLIGKYYGKYPILVVKVICTVKGNMIQREEMMSHNNKDESRLQSFERVCGSILSLLPLFIKPRITSNSGTCNLIKISPSYQLKFIFGQILFNNVAIKFSILIFNCDLMLITEIMLGKSRNSSITCICIPVKGVHFCYDFSLII